jgi:hypothetical protein
VRDKVIKAYTIAPQQVAAPPLVYAVVSKTGTQKLVP